VLTPESFSPVHTPANAPARLFVVVDTEEEFDWSAPFSRESVQVTNIQEVRHLQVVLKRFGLKPTYVLDYPVATTRASADLLASIAADDDCHIGAHLHPWVTPPFDEPLVPAMSFGCNLGLPIERAKIARLTEAVTKGLGVRPRVYKAGRYGFGESTAGILEELNYDVDASVIPHMDFRPDTGPNFAGFSPAPGKFGRTRTMLELPCTTGFVGSLRRVGEPLHRLASAAWLAPIRAVGVLSRSGMLNKVMLSPEGNSLEEMKDLTRALHQDGLRTFALTLHSSTLKPGCTRYVTTPAERNDFLETIDRYCEFFLTELKGETTTVSDLHRLFMTGPPSISH
jgi:hypothetical protein